MSDPSQGEEPEAVVVDQTPPASETPEDWLAYARESLARQGWPPAAA